jgi:WD40 repeat protein
VRIWDLGDGSARILHGRVGAVNSVAFAPGGGPLVSAGADGNVRVWDAAGGDPSLVLLTHPGGVWSAEFTPDGRSVISVGADGFMRSTPCEVCGRFADVLRLAHARADHEMRALERERFRPSG